MGKLPAFQFYPNDWRTDPELCRCSKSARDTWMDMLCLMFHCEERGILATNRVPWSLDEIAAAVRGPKDTNLADIQELLAKGVASRRSDGAIFSRRMVRDERTRQQTKERVLKHRSNGDCNASVTQVKRPCTEDEDEKLLDGSEEFEKFCVSYAGKADRSTACANLYMLAIEQVVSELGCSKSQACITLRERAHSYWKANGKFAVKMRDWLEGKMWKNHEPELVTSNPADLMRKQLED